MMSVKLSVVGDLGRTYQFLLEFLVFEDFIFYRFYIYLLLFQVYFVHGTQYGDCLVYE